MYLFIYNIKPGQVCFKQSRTHSPFKNTQPDGPSWENGVSRSVGRDWKHWTLAVFFFFFPHQFSLQTSGIKHDSECHIRA